MEFSFTIQIKESPKSINTAAVISEKLSKATVFFSSTKRHSIPGIWVQFEGDEDQICIALLKHSTNWDTRDCANEYGEWYIAHAARPFISNQHEMVVFEYATDAGKELVQQWLEKLCDQYSEKLKAA